MWPECHCQFGVTRQLQRVGKSALHTFDQQSRSGDLVEEFRLFPTQSATAGVAMASDCHTDRA